MATAKPEKAARQSPGALTAETTLHTTGIQDLADRILDLFKAAVSYNLKFRASVEIGGSKQLDPDAIALIDTLLAEALEKWKLK